MTEPVRAVVDTSSLVGYALRRDLQQAAQIGVFEGSLVTVDYRGTQPCSYVAMDKGSNR